MQLSLLKKRKGKRYLGALDTTGGIAVADKARRFAMHKAKQLGVHLVLHSESGCFVSFFHDQAAKIIGIRTRDGRKRLESNIVMGCGGRTPSIITELDGVCETTAGTVAMLKIPRGSALFARVGPWRLPSWSYKLRAGAEGGLYGFSRDERGYIKAGYRGTKSTNPKVQQNGKERSVPITRYTDDEKVTRIPKTAMNVFSPLTRNLCLSSQTKAWLSS